MAKKQESAIGYRPSEEMKKILEKYCSGPASISRGQLIEIAMQFLASQGEEKMRQIMMKLLFNDSIPNEMSTEAKKKDHLEQDISSHESDFDSYLSHHTKRRAK